MEIRISVPAVISPGTKNKVPALFEISKEILACLHIEKKSLGLVDFNP